MRVNPRDIEKRNKRLLLTAQKQLAISLVGISLIFYFVKIIFL